jgi:hypothetical protein
LPNPANKPQPGFPGMPAKRKRQHVTVEFPFILQSSISSSQFAVHSLQFLFSNRNKSGEPVRKLFISKDSGKTTNCELQTVNCLDCTQTIVAGNAISDKKICRNLIFNYGIAYKVRSLDSPAPNREND